MKNFFEINSGNERPTLIYAHIQYGLLHVIKVLLSTCAFLCRPFLCLQSSLKKKQKKGFHWGSNPRPLAWKPIALSIQPRLKLIDQCFIISNKHLPLYKVLATGYSKSSLQCIVIHICRLPCTWPYTHASMHTSACMAE